MPEDVHDYRSFLAAHAPIVPSETRFLDKTHDLFCLPDPSSSQYYLEDDSASGRQTPGTTRMSTRLLEAPTGAPSTIFSVLDQGGRGGGHSRLQRRPPGPARMRQMAMGICMAIVLPILSFPIIGGFVSRMTVVALVGLGMGVVAAQSGIFAMLAGRANSVDCAIALGTYVALMAIIALTFG